NCYVLFWALESRGEKRASANGGTPRMITAQPVTDYKKLSDFQDRVPGHRRNARLHLSTLIRWCATGVKLPDGGRLRLRAIRAGSRWLTTDEWFSEFLTALTAAHTDSGPTSGPSRTPAQRQTASRRAAAEL